MSQRAARQREQQYARQEALLRTLERLEQRDTQQAAAADLCKLVRDLDPPALSTLLHVLSVQTAKTSQFTRLECLRVMALLTTSLCPLRAAVLAPPTLNKLLGLLLARLGDSDSRVREAAAVACGEVAEQMMDVLGATDPFTAGKPCGQRASGDGATNPLLRGVLEAVTEQKRELQAAASQALAHMAGHIQPLAPPLLRQLLRALESPGFLARAELVPAFAHLAADGDCVEGSRGAGEVQGLVRSSPDLVRAHIGAIVGAPGTGNGGKPGGLLGVLAAPEWQARKAAAEALQALAVGLGLDWDGSGGSGPESSNAQLVGAVVAALQAAKYDRVKPTRESVQAAATTSAALLNAVHGNGGGSDAWMAAVQGKAGARLARSPGGGSPGPLLPPAAGGGAAQPEAQEQFSIAALKSPKCSALYPASAMAPSSLQALHQEQQRMAAALHLLTTSTAEALARLERQVTSLEALVQEQQATLASLQAGPAGGAAVPNTAGGVPAEVACALPAPPAAVAASCLSPAVQLPSPLQPERCSCPRLPPTALARPESRAASPSKGLAALRNSHAELLSELQSLRGSVAAGSPVPGSPAAAGPAPALPGSDKPAEGGEAPSMEELFSGLMVGQGSIRNELRLLRTMQKMGPVWEQLSGATAQQLLGAGKGALPKVLPWLWPLADSAATAGIEQEEKLGLLRALQACPAGDDKELGEKVSMLLSTLKACWGLTGAAV